MPDENSPLSQTLLLLLVCIVVVAGICDLLTYTIPNTLSVLIAALFPVYAMMAGLGLAEAGLHLAIALAVLVAGVLMFSAGWIGGGDAKIAAAIALWYGPTSSLLAFFMASSVAGACLGIVLLILRRLPLPTSLAVRPWLGRLLDARMGVPYGVAFCIGLAFTIEQLMAGSARIVAGV